MRSEFVATCPATAISKHFVNANKMVDLGWVYHMRSQIVTASPRMDPYSSHPVMSCYATKHLRSQFVTSKLTHDRTTIHTTPRRVK